MRQPAQVLSTCASCIMSSRQASDPPFPQCESIPVNSRRTLTAIVTLAALAAPVAAEEKVVLRENLQTPLGDFSVRADGSRLYFAGDGFLVFDARGQRVDRYGVPTAPRKLLPLPDGSFLACL